MGTPAPDFQPETKTEEAAVENASVAAAPVAGEDESVKN